MAYNKTTSTLFPTICFSILNALLLINRFSILGSIFTLAVIIYYFVRIEFVGSKNFKDSENGISHWLSEFIGPLALNFIAINAFHNNIFAEKPTLNGIHNSGDVSLAICLLIGGYILLLILCKNWISGKKFLYYGKFVYIIGLTLWISSVLINWEVYSLLPILSVVAAISLFCDLICTKENNIKCNAGFAWCTILFVVFNILNIFYPSFSIKIVDLLYNFNFSNLSPWYVSLIAIVLLSICAINYYLTKMNKRIHCIDVHIYLSIISYISLLWILNSISTKYDILFITILTVLNIVFIFHKFYESDCFIFDIEFSDVTFKYIGFILLSILLPISFYFGWVLKCICIYVLGIAIFNFYEIFNLKKQDSDVIPPHKSWYFWQFILTMITVYSFITVYINSNFAGGYILIGFVYIFTSIAFAILSFKNKLMPKNHYAMRIIISLSVIVFLLLSVNQFALSVDIKIDNKISNQNEVSQEVVGETGKINIVIKEAKKQELEAYYYWEDSKEAVSSLSTDGKENAIEFKNGCLHIVLEDQNGATSSITRWFYDDDLKIDKSVIKNVIEDIVPETVPVE